MKALSFDEVYAMSEQQRQQLREELHSEPAAPDVEKVDAFAREFVRVGKSYGDALQLTMKHCPPETYRAYRQQSYRRVNS